MRNDATISHPQVSELLVRWRDGDHGALELLVPLVYDELRRLARSYVRREMPGQSIQSAGLVHEAYLRMVGKNPPDWQNRAHFFWRCCAPDAGDPGGPLKENQRRQAGRGSRRTSVG